MKHFAKRVNSSNYFCKVKILQYQLFMFSALWNKYHEFFKYRSNFRSSHWRWSMRKAVLKAFATLTRKHVLESYFNKIANLKVSNLIKKRLWHRCFPVNIAKFLRKPILKNICERHSQTPHVCVFFFTEQTCLI